MNCSKLRGVSRDNIELVKDYWVASRNWTQILKCPRKDYCTGGKIGELELVRRRRLDEKDGRIECVAEPNN